MFTEEMEPRVLPRSGYAKDAVEVEGYVRGFARRRPDVDVTVLRFANFLGPSIDTPLTQYFSACPLCPPSLGFDARLQFLHEDDGLEVLRRCTRRGPAPARSTSPATACCCSRRPSAGPGGSPCPLPAPAVSLVGQLVRRAGLADFSPEQMRFLGYGRVVDTTRMRETLKFTPHYTTVEAFDDFVAARGLRRVLTPERLTSAERAVMTALATRRRRESIMPRPG